LKAIFPPLTPYINRKINLFFNRWTIVAAYELEYFETMITLLQPKPGGWLLMVGYPTKTTTAISAIVQLTRKGPLRVLDCGGYFQGNPWSKKGDGSDDNPADPITIAHVTTCHQVLDALKAMEASTNEFLVLDVLRPFFDPSVEIKERRRLLKASIRQLDRLAKRAKGIVTASPPVVPNATVFEFLGLLSASSDESIRTDSASDLPTLTAPIFQDDLAFLDNFLF
jgi:hypothetical protein